MSSDVTLFDFEGQDLRVLAGPDGEPRFVAQDFTRALGYEQSHHALRMLDDDMKGRQEVATPGGVQEMAVITEPGLYRLIMRSQRPEARVVERKVVTEILPSIRKTGAYVPQAMSQIDIMRMALDRLEEQERINTEEARVNAEQELRNINSTARIEALENGYDRITAIAYCKVRDIGDATLEFNQALGARAGKIGRSRGDEVIKVKDGRFGYANKWHEEVWDQAYDSFSQVVKDAHPRANS